MNTYVYEWMLCECQNLTVPASRRNRMDGRTDGWSDGWMDGQGRQMQWNVPYQHAHKSNISNKHFCRWLRIIIIKNVSYMDMHIRNVCGPRRRICTTHAHTHTLKQDTHTCIHCDIYIHTYTYRQLWKVDIESDQILYSAFYFLYLCVKDFCIITRIYNCIWEFVFDTTKTKTR